MVSSIREAFDFPDSKFEKVYHNSAGGWRVVHVGTQGDPHEERASGYPVIVDPATATIYVGDQGHYHFALRQALGHIDGEEIDANPTTGQIYFGFKPIVGPEDQQAITQALSEYFKAPLSTNEGDWHFGAYESDRGPTLGTGAEQWEGVPIAHDQGRTLWGDPGTELDHDDILPYVTRPGEPFHEGHQRGRIRNFEPGKLHIEWYDGPAQPQAAKALSQTTGYPVEEIPGDSSDWHFGNRGPSMELTAAVPAVSEWITPKGTQPWRPGGYGKGVKAYNGFWAWATNNGAPHHAEVGGDYAFQRGDAFVIHPDGKLEDIFDAKPEFRFAGQLPQIIELGHDQVREPSDHDWEQDWDMETRRPFVWHRDDNKVVIGPPGAYHSQIDPNNHATGRGAIFVGSNWPDSVNG